MRPFPSPAQVAERLEALGELNRLSASLREARGSLLTREQLEARSLLVRARVGPTEFPQVAAGLSWLTLTPERLCLVIDFTGATHHLGAEYTAVFPRNGQTPVATFAVLEAATQSFNRPMNEIPRGHKAIALLRFPLGIPEVLASLPTDPTRAPELALCDAHLLGLLTR